QEVRSQESESAPLRRTGLGSPIIFEGPPEPHKQRAKPHLLKIFCQGKARFETIGTTLFRGPRREKVAPTEQPKSGVEEARSQQPYPGNTLLNKGVPRTSTIYFSSVGVSD